ncbi:hypothetical protein IWW48_005153 [Coemansia sp. RSA 1200]|nr:hypothetical protein IWW48_005153 [Coemansia sp. RSA 1200]
MSYIPKPAPRKQGVAETLSKAHQPYRQTSSSESSDIAPTIPSKTSLPGKNLRIHRFKDNSIIRLFPAEAALQGLAASESRRLDDSAIGIHSSSFTSPALGLAPRPVSAEQNTPAHSSRVSARYRSVSDSHNTSGLTTAAASGLRAAPSQTIQKPPMPGAPSKLVRRRTTSTKSKMEAPARRPIHTSQSEESRPWVAAETDFIAQTSLRYWTGGQTVDYSMVSRELNRPQKEVRTMLQLMLLEFALFAHKMHWPLDSETLVKRWAAVEFPDCSTLNRRKGSGRRLADLANIDKCLSILRCNRSPTHRCPAASVDHLASTNTVGSSEYKSNTGTESTQTVGSKKAERKYAAEFSASFGKKHDSGVVEKAQQSLSTSSSTSQSVDDAIEAIAALTFSKLSQSQPDRGSRNTSSSSRKDINVLSCNSRTQRAHGRRKCSTKHIRAVDSEDFNAKSNAVKLSTPTAQQHVDTKRSSEAVKHVSFGATATIIRPRSHTVCSKQSSLNTLATSKTELAKEQVSDRSKETELSPEQSTDTSDFNRLDGDIDMLFFDVTAASRKFIRSFVDRYIGAFFDSFFFRVAHVRIEDSDRLCIPLERCLDDDISFADNQFLIDLQKEMLAFNALDIADEDETSKIIDNNSLSNANNSRGNGHASKLKSRLSKASLHFHICFSHAIEECKIYKDDANWQSANAYATSVFNRAIEDAHYLVFEGLRGVSGYSSGSGLSAIQYLRTDDMAVRGNRFKREYYMGIVSSHLVTRYVQGSGQQTFMKRVEISGTNPVPTALDFDDNLSEEELESEFETPWSDVSIRGELHNLIMELMPYATNASTMVAMQRSIEIYNKAIIDYNYSTSGDFAGTFSRTKRTVDIQAVQRNIAELVRGDSQGAISIEAVRKVAQCLAELWFDRLKVGVLRALMMDYGLLPVSLNEIRRWIVEGRSPRGKGFDFALNSRLYNYLKFSRVRMSEAKWLYASAAATLQMIELAMTTLREKDILKHVSIKGYREAFSNHINVLLLGQADNSSHHSLQNEPIQSRTVDNIPLPKLVLPVNEEEAQPDMENSFSREHTTSSDLNYVSVPDFRNSQPQLEKPKQDNVSSKVTYPSLLEATLRPSWQTTPLQAIFAEDVKQVFSLKAKTPLLNGTDLGLGAEARISGLETEVAQIRQEMRGISEMRRDINTILDMLYSRYSEET